MRKRLPAFVTLLLILATVAYLASRQQSSGVSPLELEHEPEDTIWQMIDAARQGNVHAYLDCYSGAFRRNLERTVSEMGEPQFSQYLKRLNEEITGIAVFDRQRPSAIEARLMVEFVLRGKNETQKHYLRWTGSSWKIDQVDGAERVKTLIP
ncbi:MAG: hypothetical protein L0338_21320, partial [Acidobacteria bacterium]|nr:hypothetical protein [Acidobacteriota bacterium]